MSHSNDFAYMLKQYNLSFIKAYCKTTRLAFHTCFKKNNAFKASKFGGVNLQRFKLGDDFLKSSDFCHKADDFFSGCIFGVQP